MTILMKQRRPHSIQCNACGTTMVLDQVDQYGLPFGWARIGGGHLCPKCPDLPGHDATQDAKDI